MGLFSGIRDLLKADFQLSGIVGYHGSGVRVRVLDGIDPGIDSNLNTNYNPRPNRMPTLIQIPTLRLH